MIAAEARKARGDMGYYCEDEEKMAWAASGLRILPEGLTKDADGLYVLPNGKYLPCGAYEMPDGGHLIYEPFQLSSFADMLAGIDEG